MIPTPFNPILALGSIFEARQLIFNLAKREIFSRYSGTYFGLIWSLINPLALLGVYTVVFGSIFKARWSGGGESIYEFGLIIFMGLIMFSIFSDSILRAPNIVVGNISFVKKIVFPIEVLPIVCMISTLFHAFVSFLILLIGYFFIVGPIPPGVLLIPLLLIPLIFFALGSMWFISSLGVYFRDVGQFTGTSVTLLMFFSPIFYPASSIPHDLRWIIELNPITQVLEQSRGILFFGNPINFKSLLIPLLSSALFCWAGYVFFVVTKKGFSDVL